MITGFFGLGKAEPYSPIDSDALRLSGVLISDTHISTDKDSEKLLKKGLSDMSRYDVPINCLSIAGDLTDNGLDNEFSELFSVLKSKNKAKQSLLSVGNHDLRQGEQSLKAFEEQYGKYTGYAITKPYYYKKINGYYFIVIGSEKKLQNEAYLSPSQLKWIDNTLKDVTADNDNPVFIICHQPLNGTNDIDKAWPLGILGEQSDELMAILKSYSDKGKTLIFCSGHLHSGFGFSKHSHDGSLYFVDTPSFGRKCSRGDVKDEGCGYVVECYSDKVVFRARNFIKGKFYEKYNYEIPLEPKLF